ncbi:MAG TPA: hypothetical protein VLM38_14930 [Blastocatellia bacterium]|nr:hypothetical protein [Blastocatellia bacterium]
MAACNCAAHSLIISASDLPLRESALLDYAFETGGVGMITEKLALPYQYKQEIAENLTALVDLLHARYRISYRTTNTRVDGAYRKIKVQMSSIARKRFGALNVLNRRGYFAP